MTELVVPFQADRYAAVERLSALIAPPYDVIQPADRARLAARDPHNVVHITLPEVAESAGDPYTHAAALLEKWRRTGVLVRDAEPSVYVLAQDFALPGGERRTRIGMFGALAAEPYGTGRVKPHERTHAGPKADRLALLRATRTGVESIFVLAPDPDGALAHALANIAKLPPAARVRPIEGAPSVLQTTEALARTRAADAYAAVRSTTRDSDDARPHTSPRP